MNKDHIEIAGKKYPVEFNWNSIVNFLERENMTLGDVDNLNNLKPSQITSLIYSGVVEGCDISGIEFPYSVLEFSRMIKPSHIGSLMQIYIRQTVAKTDKKAEKQKPDPEKKRQFFRFRRSTR